MEMWVNLKYGLISDDDHVQEHPDVWTARLSHSRWGDRIPHVEDHGGAERWVVDGRSLDLPGVAVATAALTDRTRIPQRWEEVPPSVYDPAERLKAMDADGVDYSVLYPTVAGVGGETFGRITDPDLELACVQTYNDWLVEEWAGTSDRFVPQCIVPLWPIDAAIAEIRRAVGRGHRGVVYPAVPMELRDVPHVNEPDYDPLWSTLEELDVPLCLHAGASTAIQVPPPDAFSPAVAAAYRSITRQASSISVLVHLLISRILLRHPKLRVVFGESSLGWGAYQVEFADQQFNEDALYREGYDLKPSEMFRRQCYLTGWYGTAGIQTRDIIGTDNILWSTSFPLATSSWPTTRDYVAESFAGVPAEERDRMLWGNAAKLYKLS